MDRQGENLNESQVTVVDQKIQQDDHVHECSADSGWHFHLGIEQIAGTPSHFDVDDLSCNKTDAQENQGDIPEYQSEYEFLQYCNNERQQLQRGDPRIRFNDT